MTREDIEGIAKIAGAEGAKETLLVFGVDVNNPLEVQRDFAHLRWWRNIVEGTVKAVVIAAAIGFGGALATLLWLGFKVYIKV